MSPLRNRLRLAILLPALALGGSMAVGQEGFLDTVRQDVRGAGLAPPSAPSAPAEPAERGRRRHHDHDHWDEDDGVDGGIVLGALYLGGCAVTSPLWMPHVFLQDDFAVQGYFPRFPYDHTPGYMMIAEYPATPRTWAARTSVEYLDTFGGPHGLGGNLQLSTTSRWGLDTTFHHFEERLSTGRLDTLSIGDLNLVHRFAQSEHAEFRTGLGVNWLDDRERTDFGFNFTYAVDIYPRKPWIISAALDWGTLGDAELFRFRTTGGVVLHGVEARIGWEYTDIDRTQWNALIAGLQVWF